MEAEDKGEDEEAATAAAAADAWCVDVVLKAVATLLSTDGVVAVASKENVLYQIVVSADERDDDDDGDGDGDRLARLFELNAAATVRHLLCFWLLFLLARDSTLVSLN